MDNSRTTGENYTKLVWIVSKVGAFPIPKTTILPGVITPKTLANLANSGMGPKFLKSGNRCIYLTADVLEWLEKRGKLVSTEEQQWPETNLSAA